MSLGWSSRKLSDHNEDRMDTRAVATPESAIAQRSLMAEGGGGISTGAAIWASPLPLCGQEWVYIYR